MGPSQSFVMITLSLITLITLSLSSDHYTSLVFKGCANQNFPADSNLLYKQSLKTLTDALTTQSSTAKFYKTASGNGAYAMNGLYQCRADLSNDDCKGCVKKATSMAGSLCGEAVAARVQLNGCYIRYEITGFRLASQSELIYKVCGSTRAGFGDKLNTALGEIPKGVASGFYAGGFQSVYVLGQCQGDLSGGDCVSCVKTAAEKAKSECGSSISAQIYLQECYISYTYYPNGVPGNNHQSVPSSGRGKNTQKTVAIVMGGLVGMGLVVACLLFTKSTFKKKAHTYNNYGG